MKNVVIFINAVILLVVLGFGGVVFSRDNLPAADGGNVEASPANIEGEIIEVTPSVLVIAEKGTTEKIKVELTKETEYFTAFGGFVRANELLPGQAVWVWYDDCGSSKESSLKAKIVKIFSLDPNDKP